MLLETYDKPWDFELLDTGEGYRLERWGAVTLSRPDPQIIWKRHLPDSEWKKAHASYRPGRGESKGSWDMQAQLPKPWVVTFEGTKFLLKPTPFKHTGLFAEQSAHWNWMLKQMTNDKFQIPNGTQNTRPKILNLFGYTGGATMVLAKAGCFVTHVDASKPAIAWAKENHELNNLPADSVRWILDDAVKFVKRELKRGARYEGIIMDPPAFGHSPSGKTWKFNEDLPGLLEDCIKLLSADASFLIVNGYATNSSAIALGNTLVDATANRHGTTEYGELCLKQKDERLISTGIFARWKNK